MTQLVGALGALDQRAKDAFEAFELRLRGVEAPRSWGSLSEEERDAWRDVVRAVDGDDA